MPEDQGQVDPAEALMREVGAQLREVRLERGEDLEEVAEYLRIKPTYLYGIEQGDLSVMPGRTYALGFLRSYADYLGFDGDDLINQIKWTVENLTGKTRLQIRAPLPESRLPKMPVVVLSLAVLAGVYAGWSYMNRNELVVETVAEVPDSLRRMAMEALPATGPAPAAPDTAAEPGTSPPREEVASPVAPVEPAAPIAASEPLAEPAAGVAQGPQLQPSGPAAVPARGEEEVALAPAETDPAAAPDEEQESVEFEILPSTAPLTSANAARNLATEPPSGRGAVERSTRTALASDLAGRARGLTPVPEAGPEQTAPTEETGAVRTAVLAPAGSETEDRSGAPPAPLTASTPTVEEQADPTSAPVVVAALTGRTSLEEGPGADGQGPQVFETVNADARVVLRANESSWLQITSDSGDYLRSRTLEAGDLFLVPNRPDLYLWTGNAGGLDVLVDGDALPPLGPAGAVVRDVSLDPERLRTRWQAQR